MKGNENTWDYVLVGGGLQTGLMALAIRHYQPRARVAIVERGPTLAGNHTWSFHGTDVPADSEVWIQPLIVSRWDGYDIYVGGRLRHVQLEYCTISSTHFASVVEQALGVHACAILTGATAAEVSNTQVRLSDGRCLEAAVVIDNRGPVPTDSLNVSGGYQKFWGFEVELDQDWYLAHPRVMDDRIDQHDGFRFIYTLPFERRRVLVEDTRFSNSPRIDRDECLLKVRQYLANQGILEWRIIREESGVLSMPTQGNLPGNTLPYLAGGYRGGWFHAATGYSFPMAVTLAKIVAKTPVAELSSKVQELADEHVVRARFARFLNRLLFDLVKPQTRYQIFRRFYRVLDESRIARFYGHRFTRSDAFRIVVGLPPGGLQPVHFLRSLLRVKTPMSKPTVSTIANGVTS
ncbi:MAG: lycopene beta-cyclase CrtY [Pirellulaceae bacterium]|nr:lycopene beta-cyclase CrtY [Pirellulaceae bacterium]